MTGIRIVVGRPGGRRSSDAGMSAVEVVLLTPAVIGVLLMMVMVGRLWDAHVAAQTAAATAARAASMARTTSTAQQEAAAAVAMVFGDDDPRCPARPDRVQLDTTDFSAGGAVTVSVRCQVALGDVTLGAPVRPVVQAQGVSRIEEFKESP